MARKTGDYHTEHIEWLKDPENAAGYLNAVIEEEDKDALLLALRNIAEAEGGMAAVAEKAHLKRESLYRMLSPRGNPALSNLFSILHGMGLKMTIQPDGVLLKPSNSFAPTDLQNGLGCVGYKGVAKSLDEKQAAVDEEVARTWRKE